VEPIELVVDRLTQTFLGNILQDKTTIEFQIVERQYMVFLPTRILSSTLILLSLFLIRPRCFVSFVCSMELAPILSSKFVALYKRYNNNILEALERSGMGAQIGNLRVVSPTCADDIAILDCSKHEAQALLEIALILTALSDSLSHIHPFR
jgi:hypothetical protein